MSSSNKNILEILGKLHIAPDIYEHPPVLTCEQADAHTPHPEYGLKSLLLKSKKHGVFCYVLAGNDRADIDSLRRYWNDKRISFVGMEEGYEMVGCDPGSIPPFGHMNKIPVLVSKIIKSFPIVYFNPGVNTQTYGIKERDFEVISKEVPFIWIDK